MNTRQKVLIGTLATAAIMGGGLLTTSALAATSTSTQTLAQVIASKFNLNEADVTSTISQYRTEQGATRKADMQAKLQERLDAAVTAGTLTTVQRDLIAAKQKEVTEKLEALKTSTATAAEKKTQMEAIMTDLKSWATTNSIDTKWLRPFGGKHAGHHGMGGGQRGDLSSAEMKREMHSAPDLM